MEKLEAVLSILKLNKSVTEESFKEIVYFLKPYSDYVDYVDEFIGRNFNV
jgi:hypothetical protein